MHANPGGARLVAACHQRSTERAQKALWQAATEMYALSRAQPSVRGRSRSAHGESRGPCRRRAVQALTSGVAAVSRSPYARLGR